MTEPVDQQALTDVSYLNPPSATGRKEVSGTFGIYFKYYEPTDGPIKASVLQTIHGIVGTADYWDAAPGGDRTYSFVDAAIAAGYAVLTYSSKPKDGIQVVQNRLQVGIAITIANLLREDGFGLGRKFSSVIGVGHSFGSIQLVGALAVAPTAFDAIILTGYTANHTSTPLSPFLTFQNTIANALGHTPAAKIPGARWTSLSSSYLATASQSADQLGFFSYPCGTLPHPTVEASTYTFGETLSIGDVDLPVDYTGLVQVVTGERDTVFCGYTCYDVPTSYTSKLDTVISQFPKVSPSNFSAYVVPGTGHGINFHPTSFKAYSVILDFLASHGL
ncbi:hypothetical protein RQP46_006977 [Phenoliferia psychrophenolica]